MLSICAAMFYSYYPDFTFHIKVSEKANHKTVQRSSNTNKTGRTVNGNIKGLACFTVRPITFQQFSSSYVCELDKSQQDLSKSSFYMLRIIWPNSLENYKIKMN